MVLAEIINHPMGATKRLQDMLPYQIQTTNDLLTSRAGLICIAQLMNNIGFAGLVDRYFPHPQSNRGFEPSVFVTALVIMLHEGGSCLDDLRHIRKDGALTQLLSIKVPESDSMGDWLRRVGLDGVKATEEINKPLLQLALHDRRSITLDIDATLSASQHRTAEWTYKMYGLHADRGTCSRNRPGGCH